LTTTPGRKTKPLQNLRLRNVRSGHRRHQLLPEAVLVL
jgi:hypothetical protein